MDLNSPSGIHRQAMNTAFDILNKKDVKPENVALLDRAFILAAQNYANRKFKENLAAVQSNGPAILQHLEGYIRAESYAQCLRNKTIKRDEYDAFINSENVPFYLKPYFLGFSAYLAKDTETAYMHFKETASLCKPLVFTYGRFIESSIRGAVSAASLSDMSRILKSYASEKIDAAFPIDILSTPSGRPAHIVGTDAGYWKAYEDLFLKWATPIAATSDIWLVCINFSDEEFAQVQSSHPFLKLARITATYTNIKPFYTMARFLMAERLQRLGCETIVCSDIDVFFDATRYPQFIREMPEGISGVHSPAGPYPWRNVAAHFTIWHGPKGQAALKFFVNFLLEKFVPHAPAGNRQWWIDQFPLAMLADATAAQYDECPEVLRCFNAVPREELPVISPTDARVSKEEFVARYTTKAQ